MNKTFLCHFIAFFMLFGIITTMNAQVTIGAGTAPNAGALLDLKQEGTTTKGLGMPRVKLTDMGNLFPMFKSTDAEYQGTKKDTQDAMHTGLWVYHVSGEANPQCAGIPDGLYVWNGTTWQKIGASASGGGGLAINQNYFDLPSGTDARPLNAQTLNMTWGGNTVPTWSAVASSGLAEVPFSGENILPQPLVSSPTAMNLLPDVMTILDPDKPWQSKETTMTFNYTPCGGQIETVVLNQTNYALKVNDLFTNSRIIYTAPSTANFAVEGNASWTTSKNDPNNLLTSTTPTIGTTSGENKEDGSAVTLTPNFSYTSNAAISKYYIADIIFKDTETTKRFQDITVSVLDCDDTKNDPTLNDWALRAGFSQTEINAVTDAQTGSSTVNSKGYQLHKDQSGNLFISSQFGSTVGRWMITNLAATAFVTGTRTGTDYNVPQALPATPSAVTDYIRPLWCYPSNVKMEAPNQTKDDPLNATTYANNPRLGRLYNWAAATNSKAGTTTDEVLIDDGEDIDGTHDKIQGICPNGWHLPSDVEWTALENELNTSTSQYASIPNADGTITVGASGYRGSTHAQGMQDPCPAPNPNQTVYSSSGASNVIDKNITAGTSILPAGRAGDYMAASGYGFFSFFWSASGSGILSAWYRGLTTTSSQGYRNREYRYHLMSVRCKMD